MSNEVSIFNIIEKAFGYDTESIAKIRNKLFNRVCDPFINQVFSEAKDGRKRYPIDNSFKEKIDDGWKTFNEFFSDFIKTYDLSYEDFINNRVSIDKNVIKLKKALVSFYSKKNALRMSRKNHYFDCPINNIHPVISSEVRNLFVGTNSEGYLITYRFSDGAPGFSLTNLESIKIREGRTRIGGNTLCLAGANYSLCNKDFGKNFERFGFVAKEDRIIFVANIGDYSNYYKIFDIVDPEIVSRMSNKKAGISCFSRGENIVEVFVSNENIIYTFSVNVYNGSVSAVTQTAIKDIETPYFFSYYKDKTYYISINAKDKIQVYSSPYGIDFTCVDERKKEVVSASNYFGSDKFIDFFISIEETNEVIFSAVPGKELEKMLEEQVERDINKKLEIVGTKSLPKNKDLELVLSINYADWFLCSTGESWTSCLNLESHCSSCHYQGLPGLLGDPNRVMAYITDGSKKVYEDIIVEKVFARTWLLLDSENIFNVIKFYPLEIISVKDLKDIVKTSGLKFKSMNLDFVSKNPIDLLFFENPFTPKFKASSFIFQDKTTFFEKDDEIYIKGNERNSYYTVLKDNTSGKKFIRNTSLFCYDGGTKRLLENERKLIMFSKKLSLQSCDHCGGEVGRGGFSSISMNLTLCAECFVHHYFVCPMCGSPHQKGLGKVVKQDSHNLAMVCRECATKIKPCLECGETYVSNRRIDTPEGIKHICSSCISKKSKNLKVCRNCGNIMLETVTKDICSQCESDNESEGVRVERKSSLNRRPKPRLSFMEEAPASLPFNADLTLTSSPFPSYIVTTRDRTELIVERSNNFWNEPVSITYTVPPPELRSFIPIPEARDIPDISDDDISEDDFSEDDFELDDE